MKEIWVMKAFIVSNLDTRLPVAVGEAIKAEWARLETADKTRISAENLIAEEIDSIRALDSTGNVERTIPAKWTRSRDRAKIICLTDSWRPFAERLCSIRAVRSLSVSQQ